MSLTFGVGTNNPVKIRGVDRALSRFFTDYKLFHIDVDNVVGPQPIGYVDIFKGAYYRAKNLRTSYSNVDYSVGVEAGIVKHNRKYYALQICCIMDSEGDTYYGLSPGFEVPFEIVSLIVEGEVSELEEAVEQIMGVKDAGRRGGLISIMSGGVVDREELTYLATLMALINLTWTRKIR